MSQYVAAIITAILQVLVAVLSRRSKRTAGDAASQSELRDRLRNEVRSKWSPKKLAIVAFVIVLLVVSGCSTRTIYVPSGEPVRLRQTVRSAKVWILDADGQPVAGVMDLPDGWYCLPVPEQEN